jgi:PilZ domain
MRGNAKAGLQRLPSNCGVRYWGYQRTGMARGFGFAKQPSPGDRRRSPRLRLQVPIFVRGLDLYGDEFLDLTKTLNISGVGACLASPRALHLNQLVSLRIPAPSPSSSGVIPEASPPIKARVIRASPAGDIHIVAVEFVKPLE